MSSYEEIAAARRAKMGPEAQAWAEKFSELYSKVAFEPCDQYRIPLDGDLMTCATCGWWISDHEAAE